MTLTPTLSAPPFGTAVCSDVLAHASIRATGATLSNWRTNPGPVFGDLQPASLLKHVDEQTLAALAAVFRAIQTHGLATTSFTEWGVLAAPRFLGRAAMAAALQRFAVEGAWGMSPHVIPHRSLHAVSGTLSQALKIHGPNFGVGGGTAGVVEALLAAVVLVEGNRLPGIWLALTGWEPELIPEADGSPAPEAVCQAVALALVSACPHSSGFRLRVVPGLCADHPADEVPPPQFSLEALLASLAETNLPPTSVLWPIDGGGWMELQRVGANSPVGGPETNQRISVTGWEEAQQLRAGAERPR